jgi:hypothetical protein
VKIERDRETLFAGHGAIEFDLSPEGRFGSHAATVSGRPENITAEREDHTADGTPRRAFPTGSMPQQELVGIQERVLQVFQGRSTVAY